MKKVNKARPRWAGQTSTSSNSKRVATWWSWAAVLLPLFALVAVGVLGGGGDDGDGISIGSKAPEFDLMGTDGSRQTLSGILAEGQALLYFSMGPGCDGCFAQIPEVDQALSERGVILVPVMVNDPSTVASEAQRFGITGPILIDADRTVSEAYGMLGIYGHADRPSHSFALVDQDATITWVGHYAEMFVPTPQLLADLGLQA